MIQQAYIYIYIYNLPDTMITHANTITLFPVDALRWHLFQLEGDADCAAMHD